MRSELSETDAIGSEEYDHTSAAAAVACRNAGTRLAQRADLLLDHMVVLATSSGPVVRKKT